MATTLRAHGVETQTHTANHTRWAAALLTAAGLVVALAIIAAVTAGGAPDPTIARGSTARVVDIAVLVFREGLESILVLTAITASMTSRASGYRKPIALGATIGGAATLASWLIAIRIIDSLAENT